MGGRMKTAPPGLNVVQVGGQPVRANVDWFNWVSDANSAINDLRASGSTRPTKALYVGRPFFDTNLGKPIWYDGTNWVDAAGVSV